MKSKTSSVLTLWIILLSFCVVSEASAGSLGMPPVYLERGKVLGAAEWIFDRREVTYDTRSNRYLLGLYYGFDSWISLGIIAGASDLTVEFDNPESEDYEDGANFGAGLGARLNFMSFGKGNANIFISGNAFGFNSKSDFDVSRKIGIITLDERQSRSHLWVDWQGIFGLSLGESPVRAYGGFGVWGILGRLEVKRYFVTEGAVRSVPYSTSKEDFQTLGPVFGCFGIDISLPSDYGFYAEARVGNSKNVSFSVGISQISGMGGKRTP